MRRMTFVLTAAALVVGTANLNAQTPNFAGTWTQIAGPNAPAMGGSGGAASPPITIEQDSKTLTLTLPSRRGDNKTVFNLDDTESKRTMTDAGGNEFELTLRAKWKGSTLVATLIRGSNTVTFTFSLDASGNLTFAITQPAQDGGDPVTTTRTYKKS
jgi:hypothetical protein